MDDRIPRDGTCEGGIRDRKVGHSADVEAQPGVGGAGDSDHAGRQVDAEDVETESMQVRRYAARAASEVGDERRHLDEAYGHSVSLDAWRLSPDTVASLLNDAGLSMDARLVRQPDSRERVPQAFIVAQRQPLGEAATAAY